MLQAEVYKLRQSCFDFPNYFYNQLQQSFADKHVIPLTDYYLLCGRRGICKSAARLLLKDLSKLGVIILPHGQGLVLGELE